MQGVIFDHLGGGDIRDRAFMTDWFERRNQQVIDALPPSEQPQDLVLEATYADPSGEIQTLRSTHPLWPSAVAVGVRAWQRHRGLPSRTSGAALALLLALGAGHGVYWLITTALR